MSDSREEVRRAHAALLELVCVKELREEVSRRKQRRLCSIKRDMAEVQEIARLHAECKVRETRAWKEARAVLTAANIKEGGAQS